MYIIHNQRLHRPICWTRCFGNYECSASVNREYASVSIKGGNQPGCVKFNDTAQKQSHLAAVDQSNVDYVSAVD